VVERSEIVKGYEFRKDEYVVIEPEEIKKIEPQTAKTMEILEFVKAGDVDPVYFESSYYMVPKKPAAAVCAAHQGPRGKRICGDRQAHHAQPRVHRVPAPHSGGLMLHTMYYADEVRQVEEFGAPDVELRTPK